MALRQRRKVKRISLEALSSTTGLSIGLLSQIERGLSTPSLKSLNQICVGLDMPISWLFENDISPSEDLEPPIVRSAQRRRMNLGSKGMIKDILSPDAVTDIQLMRFILHPGSMSGDTPAPNPIGSKCGTVITGCLGIEINGKEYILHKDDSFAFHANTQYRFWCVGDENCEVFWAVTPALY